MENAPEEVGQNLEEIGRNADDSERSGLVNPNNNAKSSMLYIINNILGLVFVLFISFLCFLHGIQLFSFHPILMSIGWLLLMTSAISSLSPMDAATSWIPVQSRSKRHWILQTCALLCITLGFIVIVTNKFIYNKPHFATYHSIFGLVSYILALVAASGGVVTLYSTKFRKAIAPVYTKILHASVGIVTFTLGMVTMMLGLYSGWWNAGESERLVCLMMLVFILILTTVRPCIKTYFRVQERLAYIDTASS